MAVPMGHHGSPVFWANAFTSLNLGFHVENGRKGLGGHVESKQTSYAPAPVPHHIPSECPKDRVTCLRRQNTLASLLCGFLKLYQARCIVYVQNVLGYFLEIAFMQA